MREFERGAIVACEQEKNKVARKGSARHSALSGFLFLPEMFVDEPAEAIVLQFKQENLLSTRALFLQAMQ